MTTATARARVPISRVGRPTAAPTAPSAVPSTPNPRIRPMLNATWGRIRVANDGRAVPRASSAAAWAAEKPRTSPPTMAMHVETPAVRPRTSTSSRPPRDGLARAPATSARPMVLASQASATTASPLRATVSHVAASVVTHAGAAGSYPAERIAASNSSRDGGRAPVTTAVPFRAETSTDSTPGIRSSARPTRRSHASHVIPLTGIVRRCCSRGADRVLTVLLLPAHPRARAFA